MKKQSFAVKWIFGLGIIVICAGLTFSLIVPIFFPAIQDLFYREFSVNQSVINLSSSDLSHINWIYGVLGAVMIGWGITIVSFSWHLFKENLPWIWNGIIISVLGWFLVDTGISLYYKVIVNVILNTIIFILALIPYFLMINASKKTKNLTTVSS